MFKHEAQGDYNVSRQFTNGVIGMYDADMNTTAMFSGDNAEELYGYTIHGIAQHGSYTVFNLDTGEFVVGDLGQLTRDPQIVASEDKMFKAHDVLSAAMGDPVVILTEASMNGDWRRWNADQAHYWISLNIKTGEVHTYKGEDFIDCDHMSKLDRLANSVVTCAVANPEVDRFYVRRMVQAFAGLNPPVNLAVEGI